METVISCVFFVFESRKLKTSMVRVPYNKLLTNQASSSSTGEYWPSVLYLHKTLNILFMKSLDSRPKQDIVKLLNTILQENLGLTSRLSLEQAVPSFSFALK